MEYLIRQGVPVYRRAESGPAKPPHWVRRFGAAGVAPLSESHDGIDHLNTIAFNNAASEAFLERAANPPGDTEARDFFFQHYNIRTRNLHKLDPTCPNYTMTVKAATHSKIPWIETPLIKSATLSAAAGW